MSKISSPISRSFRFVIVMAVIQLGCTGALIGWWGHLLLDQYSRLVVLETQNEPDRTDELVAEEQRNRNMILWEGAWFTAVIFLGTTFLGVFFYRDLRRSSALRAFFASLTHELKTPLTSIRLQAETLVDLDMTKDYYRTIVNRLLTDTSRLENQVERTLELARIEGGGPLLKNKIELARIVNRVVETWPTTEASSLSVHVDLPDEIILGDQMAIQIIFKNLLENTQRHSGVENPQVSISGQRFDQNLVVEYRDNGRGIESEMMNYMGQLFRKGSQSQGAGVGLYLVDTLMRRMGGAVEFGNADGFLAKLAFVVEDADGA